MEKNSQDRRVVRTQKAIVEAFNGLVLTRNYEDIKINDIAALANVGRSTFYEHFKNKDDLLARSISGLFSILANSISKDQDTAEIEFLLKHFWENRRLGRALLTGTARRGLVRFLARLIEEKIFEQEPKPNNQFRIPIKLLAVQLAEGNLALISSWLTGEAPSDSNSLACAIKDSSQAYLEALRIKTPKITVPK